MPGADSRFSKTGVALRSALAALCMTLLKLAAGLASGSLGMLSDAAHSALDLVGAGLTLLSVRVSDKPADAEHSYGHAKVENLSAFTEVLLMIGSSIWIIIEAISRMVRHDASLRVSGWPLAVLGLSMGVDAWRSRQLRAAAKATGSDALDADATHFAADIWSSAAVFVGILIAEAGKIYHVPVLAYADSVTALLVAVLILVLAWQLGSRTVGTLTDAMSVETRDQVLAEVRGVKGVLSVDQARMRGAGGNYFADLTLSLSRHLTFQRTEQLVQEATAAVQRVLPGADVVIRTVPRATEAESIFDRVRAVAMRNNVSVHEVSVQNLGDGLQIEQHVELDERMPLLKAHSFVRRIEDEIFRELPQIKKILTHIESEPATIVKPELNGSDQQMEEQLRNTAALLPEILDVHEVTVSREGDRYHLSCHCTMPDELEMQSVHRVITQLEDMFRLDRPYIDRVLIHPEPVTDNHHH